MHCGLQSSHSVISLMNEEECLTTFHLSCWPTLPLHLRPSQLWTQWNQSACDCIRHNRLNAPCDRSCIEMNWNLYFQTLYLAKLKIWEYRPLDAFLGVAHFRVLSTAQACVGTNMRTISHFHCRFSTMPLRLACPLAINVPLLKTFCMGMYCSSVHYTISKEAS